MKKEVQRTLEDLQLDFVPHLLRKTPLSYRNRQSKTTGAQSTEAGRTGKGYDRSRIET